jgi:aquaporin rerated protein, other eukaryote
MLDLTYARKQVSLGMMVVGAVPYLRGCLVIVSQLLGAISAAAVVSCMLPGPLNVRTSLGGGTSVAQGLFIEVQEQLTLQPRAS